MNNKKVLGVITARSGSKGIPDKNIKPLLGKPLIAYTIEAALRSGVLDRLIVSSDDDGIIAVAKQFGGETPFVRPAELATDTTPHLPVMQHAVRWLQENEGYSPDYVMILSPASPLRQDFHIREAVQTLEKTGADSVLSVSKVPDHFNPRKVMFQNDAQMLKLVNGDPIYKRIARRQDLPTSYWSVGLIYLFKTSLLFDPVNPNFYGENTAPLLIDPLYAVDIDTPDDWGVAEAAMRELLNR